MINKFIEWCLRNRFVVLMIFALLVLGGYQAMKQTPVDAIPNIGELQVIVYADWPGRSPVDVEDQIIYPATTRLMGTPRVKAIRSLSEFGFGLIYVIFEDGVDYYWARTRVLERLPLAQQVVPEGVTLTLGPDATALGQVFWYTIENGYYCSQHPQTSYENPGKCPIDGKDLVRSQYDLGELRSIQDWFVRYQLNSVPGVSEVAGVGGFIKQYQIDVDPNKLLSYNISLGEVIDAVKKSNIDVGAKVFEENSGGVEFLIRGKGFIKTVEDIENIVVAQHQGTPVYIKSIGKVTLGGDFRRGALDKEGKETVGAVVLMRYGENPLAVINRLKTKIKELSAGLPAGVRVVDFYDRTNLIKRTINTLRDALLEEILITVLVILVLLMHFRASMVISVVLPIGVLVGFLLMRIFKIDANVMSLGGIAIAIGVMVDSGCVMIENIHRQLADSQREKGRVLTASERLEVCISSAQEVGPAVFTALLTTIVGFIPVFVLTGESGRLFRPLAFTKTFVMIAAAFIAVMLMPTLAYYLLRGHLKLADENIASRILRSTYRPAIEWALNKQKIVVVGALLLLLFGILALPRIKREFMPPLDEGDLLFMPVLLPGASLTQVMEVMRTQDKIIKTEFADEVETVVGKLGHADTATDPAPVTMLETIIRLKPQKYWKRTKDKTELIRQIIEKTRIPGVSPIMTQPIRNRIDMLATGIQTPVGIKISGPDLNVIQELSIKLENILTKEVKGTISAFAERFGNRPYYEIEIDRREIARYGLKISDIQDVIMTAVGGENLTTTVEGRERYPVRVRYLRELRDSPEAIERIFVPTPTGAQIPLKQLAHLKKVLGPQMISSENTLPYGRVFVNVDPKVIGLVDYVNLAKKILSQKISSGELKIPSGYFVSFSGQYESEAEARKKMSVAVPLALLVILFILYLNFKSFASTLIVATGLPISLMGGVLFLYLFNFNMSVAVWVGFIALFGVATDNAVVLVSYADQLFKEKNPQTVEDVRRLVAESGLVRLRPAMMTTLTTIFALLPVMLSGGSGSEIMRPMAAPTFYGLAVVTLTNLIFVPAIYSWWREKQLIKI